MTGEPMCAYCGHPRGTHPHGERCWNDVAGIGGWRICTCRAFIEEEAA